MDPERVLAEMVDVGLRATELGPDGYLPSDPAVLETMLDRHGLSIVGGFVPAVLYDDEYARPSLAYVRRAAATLAGAGARVMVLGPDSHYDGYDRSITLNDAEWATFFANLGEVENIAGELGLATGLHPHWGMAVCVMEDVERFLGHSSCAMCLDTGHLYLAGADPVEVAKMAGDRVVHVHLKDVDEAAAEQVRKGEVPFRRAVIEGMFRPLGEGAVDITGVIRHLEANGFTGWYVLEQDTALSADPARGEGPVADARISVAYLEKLAGEL
jgi:inosose dehydratase